MLGELVPEHHFHLREVSPKYSGERYGGTNVEELLLSPVDQLPVRKLFRRLPKLVDGPLIAKVVTDLGPFLELSLVSQPRSQHRDPSDGRTLK